MPKPFKRGKKYSLLGAVSLEGFENIWEMEGTINSDVFCRFIEDLLLKIPSGSYLVLDNARIHQTEELKEIVERSGCKLVFLPPYSPDLSPIENVWSKFKEMIRRLKTKVKLSISELIDYAVGTITKSDMEEYFELCSYIA